MPKKTDVRTSEYLVAPFYLKSMKNKYFKLVSKKDFDLDELMQAYISKHYNDDKYSNYMVSLFVFDYPNSVGWVSIVDNNIVKPENDGE